MRLKDIFVRMLRERSIDVISANVEGDALQRLAVMVMNGKGCVCPGHRGNAYDLQGRRVEGKAKAFVGKCPDPIFCREELLREVEKAYFPYIVIDCTFFDKHIEKEKRKLLFQISQTLGVVRRFMWDERLIVTGLNCGVGVYYPSTTKFVKDKGLRNIVLLDPNGEEEFMGQKAECFIIGGIVDKVGNKKGWTSRLGELLEREGVKFKSLRITLRGDVVGVPDRLNTVAEIVLRVVLDGEDVESAIRAVQSRLVARWRLRKELPRRTVRVNVKGRPFRVVKKSVFEEFYWLNLSGEDFYRVCSELGYIVLDDSVFEEIVNGMRRGEVRCSE